MLKFEDDATERQGDPLAKVTTPVRQLLSLCGGRVRSVVKKKSLSKRPWLLTIIVWMAVQNNAVAQPLIEELQPLNFGTLAIAANTSVSRFTYPRTGNGISIEGQFVLIARGTPGRYSLSGFPGYTALSISLSTATLMTGFSGIPEQLTADNYDFAEITTDALGEAELSLGGRLGTSGTGGRYLDGPYTGTTVLRVEYWQPEVNSYVFNTKTIDLAAELRSTLTIDQEQQLHFGTLFARSSSTGQATLTLSPSGSYAINEPENSRMVSLAKPELGVLKVSGAAPYYSVTIAPQTADVLLEHTENPGSAPHFILSSLITSPDGAGTTDANGELLIKLGGTLQTELTASPTIYPSGQYEGTYQITVSY